MSKLIILLCAAFVSVVHGWEEHKITATAADCVQSINKISEIYVLGNVANQSTEVINTISGVETKLQADLRALIVEASIQPPITVYDHEFRRLRGVRLPILCNQEIAYKVAKLCYEAAGSAVRTQFFNGRPGPIPESLRAAFPPAFPSPPPQPRETDGNAIPTNLDVHRITVLMAGLKTSTLRPELPRGGVTSEQLLRQGGSNKTPTSL